MPSSVIKWMQYRPSERTLDIAFRDGRGTYRYFDVLAVEWEHFRAAPSKGTYLNQTFKEGGYGYKKLAADVAAQQAKAANQSRSEELFWGEA